ncbi:MAG: hypothetical protein ACO3N7_09355, partial [Kiritimatiellia bacterium]
ALGAPLAVVNAELESRLAKVDETMENLKADAEKYRADKVAAEAERAEALGERSGYRDQIKSLTRENRDLRKDLEKAAENAEDQQVELKKAEAEWSQKTAAMEEALRKKNEDMKLLASEVTTLRGDLSESVNSRNQLQTQMNALQTRLQEAESEQNRLTLNLQQESDQRKRLEKNAEMQLKTITDRMNEIISLRQRIAKLEAELLEAQTAE